jgi:Rho-binding antiterminator
MTSTSEPIACDVHDYVEVACLFGYDLRLQLQDGSIVAGKAITTITRPDKTEVLQLRQGDSLTSVPLHELVHANVLTPNARFSQIEFPQEKTC